MQTNVASGSPFTYPITEPTSALNFSQLVTEIAYKINVAYYGATGQGAPQAPIDPHDLALCQNIVNKGIRMFISDGPAPNGWKWLKPVAQVDLWPVISADQVLGTTSWVSSTAYDSVNNLTTLTLSYNPDVPASTIGAASTGAAPLFYPSMELRQIYLGGNPPANTPGWFLPNNSSSTSTSTIGVPYTIVNYLSPTQIQVFGSTGYTGLSSSLWNGASTTWAIVGNGDYTLPADFGGQYAGAITFIQNTNRGMILQWTGEENIRMRRQNYNQETGTPYWAAVRLMPTPSVFGSTSSYQGYYPQRRRWELMTWRISNEYLHILFPYVLSFNNLVNSTDVPPCPFAFDEALKAACFAVAEKEVEDTIQGPDWQYYRTIALPNAHRIDAMSSPKKLGYCGNPTSYQTGWGQIVETFRGLDYQRPTVGVNPTPF